MEKEIDGPIHSSQISDKRVEKAKDVLKVGQNVTVRVILVNRAKRGVYVNMKASFRTRAAQ